MLDIQQATSEKSAGGHDSLPRTHLKLGISSPEQISPDFHDFMESVRSVNIEDAQRKTLDYFAPVDPVTRMRRFKRSETLLPAGEEMRWMIATNINFYYMSLPAVVRDQLPITFFTLKDIVKRIKSGTGSLGGGRYYVLLEGNSVESQGSLSICMKNIAYF